MWEGYGFAPWQPLHRRITCSNCMSSFSRWRTQHDIQISPCTRVSIANTDGSSITTRLAQTLIRTIIVRHPTLAFPMDPVILLGRSSTLHSNTSTKSGKIKSTSSSGQVTTSGLSPSLKGLQCWCGTDTITIIISLVLRPIFSDIIELFGINSMTFLNRIILFIHWVYPSFRVMETMMFGRTSPVQLWLR